MCVKVYLCERTKGPHVSMGASGFNWKRWYRLFLPILPLAVGLGDILFPAHREYSGSSWQRVSNRWCSCKAYGGVCGFSPQSLWLSHLGRANSARILERLPMFSVSWNNSPPFLFFYLKVGKSPSSYSFWESRRGIILGTIQKRIIWKSVAWFPCSIKGVLPIFNVLLIRSYEKLALTLEW